MHKCFKPLSSVSSAILGKLSKSVVACAIAGVASVASGGGYCKEGLVGHWDALDNVGTGTMDAKSSVWKDLSGNGLDLTLLANGEWNTNGYLYAKQKNNYGAAIASAAAPAFTTLEVVFRNDHSLYGWSPTVFYSGSNSKIVNFSTDTKSIFFSSSAGASIVFDSALIRDITVTRVFSTDVYVDGVKDTAGTTGTGSGGWTVSSRMMLGGSSTDSTWGKYAGFGGRIYAVRLYDRVLRAGEVAANSVIDSVRYFGETSPDFIVDAEPYCFGAVSPAYGRVGEFAAGETMTFTAPATAPNSSGSASATCLGWKIYTLNLSTGEWENDPADQTKSGSGTSCTYMRPAGCPIEKLVWQWTERRLVSTSGDDVSVLVAALDNDDKLELPAGTYSIAAGTAVLTNRIQIAGAGADRTVVEVSGWNGRAFAVQNDSASISGITIRNANNDTAGTTGLYGGGVFISAGLVENCVISNCVQTGSKNSTAGGGFYMTGGEIRNCLITRCTGNIIGSGFCCGDGAYMSSGTVSGCRFVDNRPNGWAHGLGIYCAGGTLERSVFTRHNGGTTVWNAGGTIKNCLVYGNSNTVQGQFNTGNPRFGGVYQTSGRIYNCTICDNSNSKTGGSGLRVIGGDAINNIVRDNTATDGTTVSYSFSGSGLFATNLLDSASLIANNFVGDPMFVDKANGDYHLRGGSPAINTGARLALVKDDLDGNSRPFGSAPEIGCYEYTNVASKLTATLKVSAYDIGAGDVVTAIAEADGPDLTGLEYTWSIDGVEQACDGDTLIVTPATGERVISVTVSVRDGAETDMAEKTVAVHPYEVFASPTGGDVFPYDTPAKAATNVVDAFEAVWKISSATAVVNVAEGYYKVDTGFSLSTPVHVIGAGSEKTVLDGTDSKLSAFALSSSKAYVKGFTVSNFYCRTAAGGGFRMSGGLVEGCRVVKCRGTTMSGGGVYMTGGTFTNCVVRDCRIVRSDTGYNRGEGLFMEKGLVFGCTFEDNKTDTINSNGIGAHLTGGTLENCTFVGQNATPLYNAGGTVRNCLIYGNTANCADTSNYRKTGGVYQSAGKIYNCTIVANTNLASTVGVAPGLRVAGGAAVNNIVWGNVSSDDFAGLARESASAVVNTNLADCVVDFGVGNVSGNPRFRNFRHGDFRLKGAAWSNPCIDKGDNSVWDGVADPRDLDGNPRIDKVGKVVDLGCFEHEFIGLMLLVR